VSQCPSHLFEFACPAPSAPWIEFAERVLVCARRVRTRLAVEASRHGLSEPEIEMLWACANASPGGRSQTELAEDLAVSPAHVSGVVERLRGAGLLQCSLVQGDRRLRLWQLAPAGLAIWQMLIDDATWQGEAA
jgi:DNA-binding MarR family transcriptional regulator